MNRHSKKSGQDQSRADAADACDDHSEPKNSPWPGHSAPPREAPGKPGAKPHSAHARKQGVGTALNASGQAMSRVWFTVGEGRLSEVFYPRVDEACTRDLGIIVTDGQRLFSDETTDCDHEVEIPKPGIPVYRLVNTDRQRQFRIEKTVFAPPAPRVRLADHQLCRDGART